MISWQAITVCCYFLEWNKLPVCKYSLIVKHAMDILIKALKEVNQSLFSECFDFIWNQFLNRKENQCFQRWLPKLYVNNSSAVLLTSAELSVSLNLLLADHSGQSCLIWSTYFKGKKKKYKLERMFRAKVLFQQLLICDDGQLTYFAETKVKLI